MNGKVTFSFSGYKNPTPAHIARRIDIWCVILGGIITGVNSAPIPIPANVASTLSWFLGIAVSILLGIKPFYSVEVSGKTVPKEDVSVIETNEKEG